MYSTIIIFIVASAIVECLRLNIIKIDKYRVKISSLGEVERQIYLQKKSY